MEKLQSMSESLCADALAADDRLVSRIIFRLCTEYQQQPQPIIHTASGDDARTSEIFIAGRGSNDGSSSSACSGSSAGGTATRAVGICSNAGDGDVRMQTDNAALLHSSDDDFSGPWSPSSSTTSNVDDSADEKPGGDRPVEEEGGEDTKEIKMPSKKTPIKFQAEAATEARAVTVRRNTSIVAEPTEDKPTGTSVSPAMNSLLTRDCRIAIARHVLRVAASIHNCNSKVSVRVYK